MKIALIGVGLIGGSIALKLKSKSLVSRVYGVDKNTHHLETALHKGIIEEVSTLDEALQKADLIIVAVPVDVSAVLLPKILDKVSDHQTVMDVGSTKGAVVNSVRQHRNRRRFVPFHPMWGTENSGPSAATAVSFEGRAAVICDPEISAADALEKVKSIATDLGLHVIFMNAEDHDIHTAYISHISHVTSYALANTVLKKEQQEDTIFQLASSGFSSTVRLAKSHPEMWVPIFKQNKNNVLDVLNEHIAQLEIFRKALLENDDAAVEKFIRDANKIRAILK